MIILPLPTHAEAAPQMRPGAGTLLRSGPMGSSLSAAPSAQGFAHAFQGYLTGKGVKFSRGLVEAYEPQINGVPISGAIDGSAPQPTLPIDASVVTEAGESWACIAVVPNAEGVLDPKSKITMVHVGNPTSTDPALGLCAVSLILWRKGRPYSLIDALYFNVRQYQRVTMPTGPVRHLFL